jgi:hypothetical protein
MPHGKVSDRYIPVTIKPALQGEWRWLNTDSAYIPVACFVRNLYNRSFMVVGRRDNFRQAGGYAKAGRNGRRPSDDHPPGTSVILKLNP